jgi:hypothetical protein
MTATTTPVRSSIRRVNLAAMAASFAAAGLTVVRRAGRAFRSFAEAGQLGPEPKTDVGRRTGARI